MDEPELPSAEMGKKGSRDWPHAPPHRLTESGVYFLTARARNGLNLLAEDSMKDWFQNKLFELAEEFGWVLEAWSVLSNHYHFVGHSPKSESDEGGAVSLSSLIRKLHSLTTKELNRRQNCRGRNRLWQNYRETRLTFQRSYLARLHYVHYNAEHHGLVARGGEWKWSSAVKFERAVTSAWVSTVTSFRYDEIAREDGE